MRLVKHRDGTADQSAGFGVVSGDRVQLLPRLHVGAFSLAITELPVSDPATALTPATLF
jgi:hypothetical protein